jgi:hypothetical protein
VTVKDPVMGGMGRGGRGGGGGGGLANYGYGFYGAGYGYGDPYRNAVGDIMIFRKECYTVTGLRIRIGSGFNRVSGSGSGFKFMF